MSYSLRCLIILSVGILTNLAGSLFVAYGADTPSLGEIIQMERQFIESRKAIQSGRVVVSNYLTIFVQDPSQANVRKRYVTYFQDGNIRSDHEVGKHRSQIVFTPDTQIRVFSDARVANVFGPKTRSKTSQEVPDPRRLGIVVWSYDTISRRGYEEVFLNPNRDQFKIEAAVDAGESIWKVSFRLAVKGKRPKFVEYWLSESKGGLPVYICIRTGEGEKQYFRSITMKLKEYGSNHVWFPSEVVVRLGTGKQVTVEEIVTVEDAVLGEAVPDKTFTLAGLSLPKEKIVDFDGKLMTWDGERLVRESPYGDSSVEGPPQSRGRLILVLVSFLLALIAVFLWRQRAKKRRVS